MAGFDGRAENSELAWTDPVRLTTAPWGRRVWENPQVIFEQRSALPTGVARSCCAYAKD